MKKNTHDLAVEKIVNYFNESGVEAYDLEKNYSREKSSKKRPDIILPEYNEVIEVKIVEEDKGYTENFNKALNSIGSLISRNLQVLKKKIDGKLKKAGKQFDNFQGYSKILLLIDINKPFYIELKNVVLDRRAIFDLENGSSRNEDRLNFSNRWGKIDQVILLNSSITGIQFCTTTNHKINFNEETMKSIFGSVMQSTDRFNKDNRSDIIGLSRINN